MHTNLSTGATTIPDGTPTIRPSRAPSEKDRQTNKQYAWNTFLEKLISFTLYSFTTAVSKQVHSCRESLENLRPVPPYPCENSRFHFLFRSQHFKVRHRTFFYRMQLRKFTDVRVHLSFKEESTIVNRLIAPWYVSQHMHHWTHDTKNVDILLKLRGPSPLN